MSYSYSNPYAQPQAQSSRPFTTSSSSEPCQILFGGLPPDSSEHDLKELLTSPMLALSSHGLSVKGLFSAEGKPLGMALVQVANSVDAEKVRNYCSGQIIDATYRLSVQHVLAPIQPFPALGAAAAPAPALARTISAPVQPKAQTPSASTPRGPKGVASPVPVKAQSNKPPGLQLLQRMSKSGPPGAREKQAALIAQQRANMKLSASQPGKALLGRLNKPSSSPAPQSGNKGKGKGTPSSDKVARAKAQANNNKMDVDQPLQVKKGKEKPVQKTQAQLDEEMRVYERQRKFGA